MQQSGSYYSDLGRTEQIFGDPAMPVVEKPKAPAVSGSIGSGTF